MAVDSSERRDEAQGVGSRGNGDMNGQGMATSIGRHDVS